MRKRKAYIDITGQKFGRLTVVRMAGYDNRNATTWECTCECGKIVTTRGDRIREGRARSCGCLHKERVAETGHQNKTHGLCGSSLYRIWTLIIQRCTNPKNPSFESYGGRGIKVCAFIRENAENFLKAAGPRPHNKTINRIDNDGGYTCGACADCIGNGWTKNIHWATDLEQARNKRNSNLIEIDGITKHVCEWAETTGLKPSTIRARQGRGVTGKELIQPLTT